MFGLKPRGVVGVCERVADGASLDHAMVEAMPRLGRQAFVCGMSH